jgi:hypothetical protein
MGGWLPRHNGLVYKLSGEAKLYIVDVRPGPSFQLGMPRVLGPFPTIDASGGYPSPDGTKILVTAPTEKSTPTTITIVLNWASALAKK